MCSASLRRAPGVPLIPVPTQTLALTPGRSGQRRSLRTPALRERLPLRRQAASLRGAPQALKVVPAWMVNAWGLSWRASRTSVRNRRALQIPRSTRTPKTAADAASNAALIATWGPVALTVLAPPLQASASTLRRAVTRRVSRLASSVSRPVASDRVTLPGSPPSTSSRRVRARSLEAARTSGPPTLPARRSSPGSIGTPAAAPTPAPHPNLLTTPPPSRRPAPFPDRGSAGRFACG